MALLCTRIKVETPAIKLGPLNRVDDGTPYHGDRDQAALDHHRLGGGRYHIPARIVTREVGTTEILDIA